MSARVFYLPKEATRRRVTDAVCRRHARHGWFRAETHILQGGAAQHNPTHKEGMRRFATRAIHSPKGLSPKRRFFLHSLNARRSLPLPSIDSSLSGNTFAIASLVAFRYPEYMLLWEALSPGFQPGIFIHPSPARLADDPYPVILTIQKLRRE